VHWNEDDPEAFDIRTGFWFHVDGALGATFMPYVEMAHDHPDRPLIDKKGPVFDFRLPTVHSISASGHKWLGASMPTGVYMTKTKYQLSPPEIPECIGTPDMTFAGSRNGLSAMILWDNLARHSLRDQINKALRHFEMAATAEQMLRRLQDDILHEDLRIGRSELSLTIRFKRANDNICKKYSLSNDTIDGLPYSHIFIMEHVTEQLLTEFIDDLKLPGAFDVSTSVASEASVISNIAKAKGLVAPSSNRLFLLSTANRGFRS
jgi:histidine decarboxylase